MILDEVLQEENRSFDVDDMVDIFTEGFLYALEMQEAGYKAGSTEELSKRLVEAADIAIGELSHDFAAHAANKAAQKASKSFSDLGNRFEHGIRSRKGFNAKDFDKKVEYTNKKFKQADKFANYSINKAKKNLGWK